MRCTALIAFPLLFLFGCPGTLDDPSRFTGPSGQKVCTLGINVETDIFGMTCAGASCHGDGINPGAGGIDLVKAGVTARLFDKPAVGCAGRKLVDTASVGMSVILARVAGPSECGVAMPLGTTGLTVAQQDCIEAWIIDEIMSSTTTGAM